MVAFIVFYGLDWVATVPPTLALCREFFGPRAPVVFGWVFASHQVGSAFAAFGGGVIRDVTGSYDLAWFLAGALCIAAAAMSFLIPRTPQPAVDTALPTDREEAAAAQAHG
jgi:predicted MFS family arabinose efflux permease